MQYVLPALSAFILTVLSILIALKIFPKLGLMDRPQKYGLKRDPIPYPGGILVYLIFTALTLIFFDPTLKLLGLLLGGGILVLVSFIDDRFDLPPWFRLLVQTLVAILLIIAGIGIPHITNPFGGTVRLDQVILALNFGSFSQTILVLSALFTILWILLIVNTMNWIDGIPGLTSGVTVIGGLTLFFLSISDLVNQPEIATLSLILAMIALGFWCFDFFPPKILLGDSGAMFMGLVLATLAIFSGGKIATAFLVLGFPLIDALYVMAYRILSFQPPWKGGEWDKNRKAVHLHHRLLKAGLSERQVLLLAYTVAALFGTVALITETRGKFWAILVIAATSLLLALFLRPKNE